MKNKEESLAKILIMYAITWPFYAVYALATPFLWLGGMIFLVGKDELKRVRNKKGC